MALEGFEEDENGNPAVDVFDVTITVGVHNDTIILEQPGDNGTDCILLLGLDQVRGVTEKLNAFLASL